MMTQNAIWKEVRPIDRYQVRLVGTVDSSQLKALFQLYQPLIGQQAIALYTTLWSETEGDFRYTAEKKHEWLIKAMNTPLDQIYASRLRLEGVGLLRTYRSDEVSDQPYRLFVYELHPPLSIERFFADDVLSVWLYNRVGAAHFKQLRARYSGYFSHESQDGTAIEVTKSFYEVFASLHPSELMIQPDSETEQGLQEAQTSFPIPSPQAHEASTFPYEAYPFDVELVKSFLLKGVDERQIFTPENTAVIKKMAMFYRLSEQEMGRLIQDSLGVHGQFDLNKLRRLAREYYLYRHRGLPQVRLKGEKTDLKPSDPIQANSDQENALEEAHLQVLAQISPLQLLAAYQEGGKVAEADARLVEELVMDYQLAPSVVNVLLEYVLFTNQFRLPRQLVTKVAAHWKRLKITDMREALELAKKEHQEYKKWQEKRKARAAKGSQASPSGQQQKKMIKKDVLPEWIADQEAERKGKGEEGETLPFSDAEKRKRIQSLLKALGEWEE